MNSYLTKYCGEFQVCIHAQEMPFKFQSIKNAFTTGLVDCNNTYPAGDFKPSRGEIQGRMEVLRQLEEYIRDFYSGKRKCIGTYHCMYFNVHQIEF